MSNSAQFIPLVIDPERALRNAANSFSVGNIIPELLQNARRAGASSIWLADTRDQIGSTVVLCADNGRGLHGAQDFTALLGLHTSGWDERTQRTQQPAGLGMCSAFHNGQVLVISEGGMMVTTPEGIAKQSGADLQPRHPELWATMQDLGMRTLIAVRVEGRFHTHNKNLWLSAFNSSCDGQPVRLLRSSDAPCAWESERIPERLMFFLSKAKFSPVGQYALALAPHTPPLFSGETWEEICEKASVGDQLVQALDSVTEENGVKLARLTLPEHNVELEYLVPPQNSGNQYRLPEVWVDWYGTPIQVHRYGMPGMHDLSVIRTNLCKARLYVSIALVIRPIGPVEWSPLLPARTEIKSSPEFVRLTERVAAMAEELYVAVHKLLVSANMVHVHGEELYPRESITKEKAESAAILSTSRAERIQIWVNGDFQLTRTWLRKDNQRRELRPEELLGLLGNASIELVGRPALVHSVLDESLVYSKHLIEDFEILLDDPGKPDVASSSTFGRLQLHRASTLKVRTHKWLLDYCNGKPLEQCSGDKVVNGVIPLRCALAFSPWVEGDKELSVGEDDWSHHSLLVPDTGRLLDLRSEKTFNLIEPALYALAQDWSDVSSALQECDGSPDWGDDGLGGSMVRSIETWLCNEAQKPSAIYDALEHWLWDHLEPDDLKHARRHRIRNVSIAPGHAAEALSAWNMELDIQLTDGSHIRYNATRPNSLPILEKAHAAEAAGDSSRGG